MKRKNLTYNMIIIYVPSMIQLVLIIYTLRMEANQINDLNTTMDEIKNLLSDLSYVATDIRDKLTEINDNLSDIKGYGLYTSISDINDKFSNIEDSLNSITGHGAYGISDIVN
ncbi:hypothetical protein J3A84_05510 [Proteiniclasticum sp. SCR006]|uniref:Uncharacterized protein n=1 Tax=Proteiniclasticum aestuarii TaxID=2817862 RepID=A0A939KIZ2_9CLOT|nr:hypothetical protein [Proteiniclasticum aestuarii]MBO1264496.1 hypothetical protein [Proteiniclasticum aestuarii]